MTGAVLDTTGAAPHGLAAVVDALPRDFPAAVFVVGANGSAQVCEPLRRASRLPLVVVRRRATLEPGVLYVAAAVAALSCDPLWVYAHPVTTPDLRGAAWRADPGIFADGLIGVAVAASHDTCALDSLLRGAGGERLPDAASATSGVSCQRVGALLVARVEELRNAAVGGKGRRR